MALEGLGVASSAFAVVSLAGQLAEGIQKLVVFWKSVQNAPAEISNLFNELEILSRLLSQVRKNGCFPEIDPLLSDALKDCEGKVSALQSKISKAILNLKSKGRSKRSWAALKVTIKKKEIEELGASIDRAKITLQLIQTTSSYNLALWNRAAYEQTAIEVSSIKQCIQHLEVGLLSRDMRMRLRNPSSEEYANLQCHISTIERQIQMTDVDEVRLKLDEIDTPSDSLPSPCSCQNTTIMRRRGFIKQRWERALCTPLLDVRALSRSYQLMNLSGSEALESAQAESNYVLFPNSFLQKLGVSMGIQLTASSTLGWKYTLQPFRAVRSDALIFDLCQDGNLSGIRRLFARGEASPYDRDPSGSTPLTVAVRASQIEVVEFLLQQGSDPHSRDWHFKRQPIQDVIDSQGVEIGPKLSMINLLQRYRKEDYEISDLSSILSRVLMSYRPQKEMNMSQAQRQDAQLRVFTAVMPHLASGDLEMVWGLEAALSFACGPEVLNWLLQQIKGSIDNPNTSESCLFIPHRAIHKRVPLRAPSAMKMIMQKTTNLHRCIKNGSTSETPTMIAMRDRSIFLSWRRLLYEIGQDIPEFVRAELQDGLLREAGWTEISLRYLLNGDLPDDLHIAPSLRGFPACERCHKVETDVLAHLVVDLKWRRELRMIRHWYQPKISNSNPINNNLSSPRKIPIGDYPGSSHQELNWVDDRERLLPYRIVCSSPCRDGICVAWAFEDDTRNEPDLPLFPYTPDNVSMGQSNIASGEEDEDVDPTLNMPGSFKESPTDASQYFSGHVEALTEILI